MDSAILDSPYRNNAFRLAALRIDTEDRRVRNMVTELEAGGRRSRRLIQPTVLPVIPQPPITEMTAALEKLGNPADRLIDELLWFWPTDYVDPATDGIDSANRRWLERLPSDPIAAHNLAVLRHIEAIETPRGEYPETWLDALTAWDMAIGSDETWQWLGERAERIGRSRYRTTSPELDRIRMYLPAAVLRIHTNTIAHTILAGQMASAEMQFDVLDEFRAQIVMYPSVFDFTDIDFARNEHIRQLELHRRRRYGRACRTAERRPKEALLEARRLLKEERGAREYFHSIPMDDSATLRSSDSRTADTAIKCVVAYFDATKDIEGAREVLAETMPFAVGAQLAERLDRTTGDLEKEWLEYICRFCRVRRGVVGAEYSQFLSRPSYRRYFPRQEVVYDHVEVAVPRCKGCRAVEFVVLLADFPRT
ncbi:hypothetical protein ACFV4K_18120 [Nocardia sp. NPDC059764]|uniref:hypothetical protein n=1 Tax=Nocardia sp. NPDC059764 TaxID=3346939 RepID=UPI0036647879